MGLAAVPSAPRLLGFLGAIPFVALAVAAWSLPFGWAIFALRAQAGYAAVILSFLGAIHWGIAMARGEPALRLAPLAASVTPALLGWLLLFLLPLDWMLGGFALAFAGVYMAELRLGEGQHLPGWYLDLRRPLTVIVMLSLAAGLAWILVQRGG